MYNTFAMAVLKRTYNLLFGRKSKIAKVTNESLASRQDGSDFISFVGRRQDIYNIASNAKKREKKI